MTKAEALLRYCPWMLEAQSLLGQAEIPGPRTAGFIAAMLKNVHAWWGDDETPWCGVFVAHCLKASGLPLAKQWWRARGWEGYGRSIPRTTAPQFIPYGALVVLDRPPKAANGHVGFFSRRIELSHSAGVSLLGGNQGNKVAFASFPLARVVYWCWPGEKPLSPDVGTMLVAYANGRSAAVQPSTGEA